MAELAARFAALLDPSVLRQVHLVTAELPLPVYAQSSEARLWLVFAGGEVVACHDDDPARIGLLLSLLRPVRTGETLVRQGVLRALAERVTLTVTDPGHPWAIPAPSVVTFPLHGSRPERLATATYLTEPIHRHPAPRGDYGDVHERLTPISTPSYLGAGHRYETSHATAQGLLVVRGGDQTAADARDRTAALGWASFALHAIDPRRWRRSDGSAYLAADAPPRSVWQALRGDWANDAYVAAKRAGGGGELIPAAWLHLSAPGRLRGVASGDTTGTLAQEAVASLAENFAAARLDSSAPVTGALTTVMVAGHATAWLIGLLDGIHLLALVGDDGRLSHVSAGWTEEHAVARLRRAAAFPPRHCATLTETATPEPVSPSPAAVTESLARQGMSTWLVPLCPDRRVCAAGWHVLAAIAVPTELLTANHHAAAPAATLEPFTTSDHASPAKTSPAGTAMGQTSPAGAALGQTSLGGPVLGQTSPARLAMGQTSPGGAALGQTSLGGPVLGQTSPARLALGETETLREVAGELAALGGLTHAASLTGGAEAGVVWSFPGRLCVGPLPDRGCAACARSRRSRVEAAAAEVIEPAIKDVPSGLLVAIAADLAAETESSRISWAEIDLDTLDVTYVSSLAEPKCPRCRGGGPLDSPERARLDLASVAGKGSWRAASAASLLDKVRRAYVESNAGLVTATEILYDNGLCAGVATAGDGTQSWGFQADPMAAEAVAILEALERFGGEQARGFRPSVRASFAEVADLALDPARYGTHDSLFLAERGFPLLPHDRDTPREWVWAWSLVSLTARLVPYSLAFYGETLAPSENAPPPVAYEVSNGCAIGGSDIEACIAGLLEVVERDAFLMTWLRRLELPALSRSTLGEALRGKLTAIESRMKVRICLYDTTMEHGIPSAMAVSHALDPQEAQIVCAPGSGLTLPEAIGRALSELAPFINANRQRYAKRRHEIEAMLHDPRLVTRMEDHPLLLCHPEAAQRFAFLDKAGVARFDDARGSHRPVTAAHPAEVLAELVERLGKVADDVLVVRQTSLEHEAAGLSAVKVLVPQLLPITFGYTMRRTENLNRLWTVPGLLAIPAEPGLNPHPHPFA